MVRVSGAGSSVRKIASSFSTLQYSFMLRLLGRLLGLAIAWSNFQGLFGPVEREFLLEVCKLYREGGAQLSN